MGKKKTASRAEKPQSATAQEEDHEPSQFIQVTTPPRFFTEGFLIHTQNDHDRLSKISLETG